MHQRATHEQPAGRLQRAGHRIRRLEDMHAGEQRHPVVIGAVVAHHVGSLQAIGAAEHEVVLAVAGRGMDEAGAGLGRHIGRRQQRHVEFIALSA